MKELPFFKLNCQEWMAGDISLENDSIKGLFMDILVYFWIQNCSVLYPKLLRKFPRKTQKIKKLVESGIIKVVDNHLRITFLEKEMAEITSKSKYLSDAGKRGVVKREANKQATLKPPLSNRDKEEDKEEDKDKGKPKKSPKFSKPHSNQIKAYCMENGYDVDASRFVDYYDANGWKVGRNSMKDWKATVRTWNSRNKPQVPPKDTKVLAIEQNELKRRSIAKSKLEAFEAPSKADFKGFKEQLKQKGLG